MTKGQTRFFLRALLTFSLLGPLGFLLWTALWSSSTSFLPPSFHARWAFHPDQELLPSGPVSERTTFRKVFYLDEIPPVFLLDLRAFKKLAGIQMNGLDFAFPGPSNWKSPRHLDVSSGLLAGRNSISITVENATSIPALLVESPALLRTPDGWAAAPGPGFDTFTAATGPILDGPPRPLSSKIGKDPSPLLRWKHWKHFQGAVLALILPLLAYAFFRRLFRGLMGRYRPVLTVLSSRMNILAPTAIIGVAAWLGISNAFNYPYESSAFDWYNHIEYVLYIAQHGSIPTASEGFMMYQPPLYYLCASIVYKLVLSLTATPHLALKCVQLIGALSGVSLGVICWLLARRIWPDNPTSQWVAIGFGCLLPMNLYMSPVISNEVFAAAISGSAIYLLIALPQRRRPCLGAAFAGVVAGLGLLSKYTALFVFLGGVLFLLFRCLSAENRNSTDRSRRWLEIGAFCSSTLAVCGWFYVRNVALFGHPFVANWDLVGGQQNPGYRTWEFYLKFGAFLTHHPERLPWISWFDGHYGSMWGDVHRHFLRPIDDSTYVWVGMTYLLAILPTLAVMIGLGCWVVSALRDPVDNGHVLLAVVPIWTWYALLLFSLNLPFYSTIKAFYFLSLVPILGVGLAQGRQLLTRFLPPIQPLLDTSLVLTAVLIVYLYHFSANTP